jgi:ATP-binding cassette, subfamily B, bacterial
MSRGISAEYWKHLKPFAPPRTNARIGLVGVASFLGSLAESAVLVLVTLTADSLIRDAAVVELFGVTLGRTDAVILALAFVGVRIIMTVIAVQTASRFSAAVMERAQTALLVAYLDTSHAARSSRPSGDLPAVTASHGRFTGDMANAFGLVATSVFGLIAFIGTSLVVNPLATVAIAVIGTLLLLLMRPLRARSRAAAGSFSDGARRVSHELTEIESLHREIEVFRVRDQVFERATTDTRRGSGRFQRLRFLTEAIPQLYQALLLGAAVLSLLLIVNTPAELDLAAVGAVVLLMIRSMSSAQQLVTANQRVIEFGAYTIELLKLIADLRSESRSFGSTRPDSLSPVALDHVGFSYDGETEVLRDLSVEIDEGELVGVVGPSGAGKSTFVELLLRLRPPTGGTIRCGGVPIDEIHPEEFASRVAFVPQQPVLITGTVAENVDLFRGLPEDRLRAALKQAHLEDEIEALPDGIHTRLGADDRALSGGQRQRLTIARALAGDPDVLILDEPTSALDAVSENAVRQTLTELPSGRIVVVVAHRYSTLRSCSRILVLRDGVLEMDATPDEVAAQSEFFQTMVSEGG